MCDTLGSKSGRQKKKPYPLKFFDDFKLKIASKHPFSNHAIYFILLNSFLESNHKIF
jgi:hypothetical protein